MKNKPSSIRGTDRPSPSLTVSPLKVCSIRPPRSPRRCPLTADVRPLSPSPCRLNSDVCPLPSDPKYGIRRHLGFWSLTFNGQEACFDHEQGAYYVAYLLLNPPSEPIHGMALEIKSMAYFGQFLNGPAETEIVDPSTGETMILACDAIFEQRNFALDDADSIRPLRRKQLELEAILDNEHASEPVKAEVQRELAELYAWQKKSPSRIMNESQKAVRAVREAIRHFHVNLEKAVDPRGNPHPVLRPFAAHLKENLLIPSSRYSKAGRGRIKTGVAGCFTYEPPSCVKWTA